MSFEDEVIQETTAAEEEEEEEELAVVAAATAAAAVTDIEDSEGLDLMTRWANLRSPVLEPQSVMNGQKSLQLFVVKPLLQSCKLFE